MHPRRRSLSWALLSTLILVPLLAAPAHGASITARAVATGLEFPVGFDVAPSGKIFYGERFTGEIRVIDPATGKNTLFFTIPNVPGNSSSEIGTQHFVGGEQGLLGIALHPDFPTVPYVYAFATREVTGGHRNQVLRITNNGGTGSDMKVLWGLPSSTNHNGGRLLFGPDRMLYLVTGDAAEPANAQDLGNAHGKVLRMTPAGGVPADNPFTGSRIWAYGIRNSIGLAFDSQTGRLWETENGPECNDELNRIMKGRNYGWGPSETCATPPEPPANTNQDGPSPVLPIRWYTPPPALTGAVFCQGCGLASGGMLFVGDFNNGAIRRVVLTSDRTGVTSQSVVYTHTDGILSMEAGPDGRLYFSDRGGIYTLTSSS